MGDIGSCSHSRSHELYLASLTVPCPVAQVGLGLKISAKNVDLVAGNINYATFCYEF